MYERIVTAHASLKALSQSSEPLRAVMRREALKMGLPSLFMSAKSTEAALPENAATTAANQLEKLVAERHRISGILNFNAPRINYGLVLLGQDCGAFDLRQDVSQIRSQRLSDAIRAFVEAGMATSTFAGV